MIPAVMAKSSNEQKKTLFSQKVPGLILYSRKISKILNRSTVFYGAGNWTRRKANQKYLESFLNVALEKYGKRQLDVTC
jgi:hypothetical protein